MSGFGEVAGKVSGIRKNDKKNKIKIVLLIVILIIIIANRHHIYNVVMYAKDSTISFVGRNINKVSTKIFGNKTSAELVDEDISGLEPLTIESITADSTLYVSEDEAYIADNMIDGDINTCWQEGEADFGSGKAITINFGAGKTVKYLVIYNGNQADDELYSQNNRLRKIKIIADNKTFYIELQDTKEPQIIKFTGVKYIKKLDIEIVMVYGGTDYNDTCVSEIICY